MTAETFGHTFFPVKLSLLKVKDFWHLGLRLESNFVAIWKLVARFFSIQGYCQIFQASIQIIKQMDLKLYQWGFRFFAIRGYQQIFHTLCKFIKQMRQANGIEAVLCVFKLTTVKIHGLGWNPSIRMYPVWSCQVLL